MADLISSAEILVDVLPAAEASVSSAEILVDVLPAAQTAIASAYFLVEVGPYERPAIQTINEPEVDSAPAYTPVSGIAQNVQTVTIYSPSYKSAAGISLQVWKPRISSGLYVPEGAYIRSMENIQTSWSHVISVDGGYKSASMTMAMTRGDVDDWVSDGLGRHIVAFNEAQQRIFEGFVNKVTVNNGPLTHVRGPLVDITNRLTVSYTPIDPDTGAKGITTETQFDYPNAGDGNDAASQRRWGLFEQVLNAGECTDDEALQYRSLFLSEYAEPAQTNDISLGGTGGGDVSIEILGYITFLEKFVYTNDSPFFATATDKIRDIVLSEPNGIFTDVSGLDANAIAVPLWEGDRSSTGKSIIDGIVAQGDVSDLRTFFGIYANRRAIYQSRPTTVFYHQRLADEAHRILDAGGNAVLPWNVKPGKWLYIDDFALSAPRPLDLRNDPRAMLIEQVSYSAPWGLGLQGSGSVRNLPQWVAKLGLKGRI